ncbi:MAG: quinone-dependent dihydroorotate dehydrogenase [Patescibacteria group bacterium]|nr:quinone-dependent dihydroorotate dehydrogenase [Patescibacteria group bacterium]
MSFIYEKILKPVFFLFDPEAMHHFFNFVGRILGKTGFTRWLVRGFCWPVADEVLETDIAGIKLAHPLGVGAGFDKEGRIVKILKEVGFSFVEVGTVTGQMSPGNPRPRLWRLPLDNALVVNYGLVSSGADVCRQRFAEESEEWPIPVGISVAKSNVPNLSGEAGLEDLLMAFQKLQLYANYVTVNVSCPNVGDDCLYCDDSNLYRELLKRINDLHPFKPVFFKLSPELSEDRMLEILRDTEPYPWAKGFVLTNLTHSRDGLISPKKDELKSGGVSGPGLRNKADKALAFMAKNGGYRFEFIGIGGIDSVDDLYRKIRLGASAVQIVTGLIYHGPLWPSQLMRELSAKLKEDGFKNVREAIGVDVIGK